MPKKKNDGNTKRNVSNGMQVRAIKTRIFKEGEDLFSFITTHVKKIKNSSVLVVTSKIVALAEGRMVDVQNEKTREQIIKAESEFALKTPHVWLTLKDGLLMPNAGTDESNAGKHKLILLPNDSYKTARALRARLLAYYRIKDLGIIITDSRVLPLRAGTVGVALGYAGFKGIRDYRNTKDLFGRTFKISRSNIPDALASCAVLLMGEGTERCPLAVIENAPVIFTNTTTKGEISIAPEDDLYRPFFDRVPALKRLLAKRGGKPL